MATGAIANSGLPATAAAAATKPVFAKHFIITTAAATQVVATTATVKAELTDFAFVYLVAARLHCVYGCSKDRRFLWIRGKC